MKVTVCLIFDDATITTRIIEAPTTIEAILDASDAPQLNAHAAAIVMAYTEGPGACLLEALVKAKN